MAQHKVGLFHHATDTLKAALKHKSTKAEARAAIKAMKAEQEAMMAEQVRLAEEALGPKPPVDPTIERHQQNESYIDYMARVCKQQEEQESAEWERERRAKDLAAAAVKLETATVTVHPVEAGSTTSETSSPSNASEPNSDSSTPAESILATANAPTPVVDTSTDSAATMNLSEEEIAARNVADQFVIIAAAYTKKADYAQALKQLGKAIKRAPAYAAPYVQRGEVHMAMGSTALAVADFMKVCTELDKTDGATKSLLVQIAAELALAGKHSEAEVILAPLDAQLPIDETFCLNQAAAFVRQGDLQGAIRSLERMGDAALAASPQAQRLLAQLGASSGDTRTDGAASSVAEDVRLTVEQVAGSDAGSPNSATAGAPGGLHRRSRWVRHAADGAAAVAADGTAENVDVEPSATQL
jgi:tetratricopeptide (TPR) repeat protein